MSNIHFHKFINDDELALKLALAIAEDLSCTIKEKGSATLLVSGGITPLKLFSALSFIELEWEHVRIGLCDERWISPSHNESNEKLIRETLLQNYALKATFVGMYIKGCDAVNAEAECSQKIRSSLYPFDVIVLGMGNDAHTASLFPNNTSLSEAYTTDEICIAMEPTTAPHTRMSLTLKAILSSSRIYLHFQGDSKLKVYNEAMSGDDIFAMPIRSILKQHIKKIEVYFA
ncbi:MAG: 6-phosphogluconolactonase [Thiovulaceae bacterium]|nr:6-phosphogluconolactonase [Sulfurimonadaceae bacterium]